MRDTSPEKLRPISVVWSELDQVTTTKLVENCREHSSTVQVGIIVLVVIDHWRCLRSNVFLAIYNVQAALTVAGMVAVLVTRNSDKDNSNTHETEYTFLNQVPDLFPLHKKKLLVPDICHICSVEFLLPDLTYLFICAFWFFHYILSITFIFTTFLQGTNQHAITSRTSCGRRRYCVRQCSAVVAATVHRKW